MSDKPLNEQGEPDLPGERLYLHEGSVVLPADYEDRTTNVFVPADLKTQPNLSIARDWLQAEEDLEAYVERQCAMLKKRMPGYKLLARNTAELGLGTTHFSGIGIETSYKNGPEIVWQRQAAFLVAPRRALIFTASHTAAPDTQFNTLWTAWLSSFRLLHNPSPPPDP